VAEKFTPPGERSYAETQERNIEAIQDEEQRKEEAEESDFVEVDDEGKIDSVNQEKQGTRTDTDLDGEKETSPGAVVGAMPGDFESGKADQIKNARLAEQKKRQLEQKKQNLRASPSTTFQTGNSSISKDEAISQVNQQIQDAEEAKEQSQENIQIIERNQDIKAENQEIRQAESIAEAERFFTQQALKEQAQENKERLKQEILEKQEKEETQSKVTFVEKGLNRIEEAGQELVLKADQEKDVIGDLSEKIGASNVGNDFAALFESLAGAKPTVQEAQDFDTSEPLKSTEELADTGKEEILNPLLITTTKADEIGLIEPSQDLKERTKSVQGTAASTPLDTAGFVGAAGGGAGTIFFEELSRLRTTSGRILTGNEDFGRDFRTGEGLERIPVGSAIIADTVSEKPGKFAQEEITQEVTEAVVGLGVPTTTVTATPSNLKTRFEGTVKTASQRAKDTGIKLKDSVTDPNALGAGPGALLPSESPTETPSPTQDTVTVDRDALDAFEVNPLQPETIPSTQTQTTTTSPGSSFTPAAVPTATSEPRADAVTEPQTISQGKPQTLTDTVSQTQSVSQTPSLTDTLTLTQTPSQSASATETPTTTPTQTRTNTPTATPTPTPEFEDETNLLNEESNNQEKETSTEFLPSVDALLTGKTKEVDEDEVFTGFETRPLQEL